MPEDSAWVLERVLSARDLLQQAHALLDPMTADPGDLVTPSDSPLLRAKASTKLAQAHLDEWLDRLTLGKRH